MIAPYNTVEVARFASTDNDVVSISTGARVTAKNVGTTYVYAMVDNGLSKCKITVVDEETYQKILSDISSGIITGDVPEATPSVSPEPTITPTATPTSTPTPSNLVTN